MAVIIGKPSQNHDPVVSRSHARSKTWPGKALEPGSQPNAAKGTVAATMPCRLLLGRRAGRYE